MLESAGLDDFQPTFQPLKFIALWIKNKSLGWNWSNQNIIGFYIY